MMVLNRGSFRSEIGGLSSFVTAVNGFKNYSVPLGCKKSLQGPGTMSIFGEVPYHCIGFSC